MLLPQKLNFICVLSITFQITTLSHLMTFKCLPSPHRTFLEWKFHVSSFAELPSVKLDVLCHFYQFFSPLQMLALYRSLPLFGVCLTYSSRSTHSALLNRVESKTFHHINSLPTDSSISETPLQCYFSNYHLPPFYDHCSFELANYMPPFPLLQPHCVRHSTFSSILLTLLMARVN